MNSQAASLERVVKPVPPAAPTGKRTQDHDGNGKLGKLYNHIANEGYYPIFVNWSSSLVSSYFEQLMWIRQGEQRKWIGPLTAIFELGVDVARAIVRAPQVWIAQRTNDAKTLPLLDFMSPKDADAIADELVCVFEHPSDYHALEPCREKLRASDGRCPPFTLRPKTEGSGPPTGHSAAPAFPISIGKDCRSWPEIGGSAVSYGLTLPSRFLIEPVVDAVGTNAWDHMLRRTRLLFNVDDEFYTKASFFRDRSPLARQYKHQDGLARIPRSGGLSLFLRALHQEIKKDRAAGRSWEITLIGHSMGTIVLNQILRESMQLGLDLPVVEIVYLAAAASVRDFQDSVIPFLQSKSKPPAQFYNLMLHPMAELRESYRFYGIIPIDPGPRGSLLVMIDNFITKPPTMLDRTAGQYENFLPAVHNIPLDLRSRVHVKTFAVGNPTRDTHLRRHGHFTERFRFWIAECWKPEPAITTRRPGDCVYDDP